jgi:hypothetical protein
MFLFTIALLVILLPELIYSNPVKRVLLEQFTGAWCGWCPDGTVYMDSIMAKYPDKVIGVKLHYGDNMETVETYLLNSSYAFNAGWPSGSVDRTLFYDSYYKDSVRCLDRGLWENAVVAELQKEPVVDVALVYYLDTNSRKLYATVSADFLKDLSGDIRLNAYIIEDDVTGTGKGYDQNNNYSNNSKYPNHPYHNKPAVIKGYQHKKVVRKILGGSWGSSGTVPTQVKAGDKFYQNYEYILDSTWNINKLSFIGFAQLYDTDTNKRIILNVVNGEPVKKSVEIALITPNSAAKGINERLNAIVRVKNLSNIKVDYVASINKSTRTPGDWNAGINNGSEYSIPANSTLDIPFYLEPGNVSGIGDAIISIGEKETPANLHYSSTITALSKNIQKVNVFADEEITSGMYSLYNSIINSGRKDFIEVESAIISKNIMDLNNLKLVSWNCGEFGNITHDDAVAIDKIIDNGAGLLISGTIWTDGIFNNKPELFSKMGIGLDSNCFQGMKDMKIYLDGYDNDPITNAFSVNSHLSMYYTIGIKINGSNTFPIIKHRNTDTILAARTQLANSRLVLLSLNPALFDTTAKTDLLIKRSLDWIEGLTDVTESEPNHNIKLKDFPNKIVFENKSDYEDGKFTIYNLLGDVIFYKNSINSNQIIEIYKSELNQGIYFYNFSSGNFISSGKFLIVK